MKIQKEGFVALVKSTKTRILAAIFLMLVCVCTIVAANLSSYEVKIVDGEKNELVHTSETDALAILKNEGYTLKDKDELDKTNFKPGKDVDNNELVIVRSHKLVIDDQGTKTEKIIAARTVSDAIKKAKISVFDEDKISPSLNTSITKNLTIKIKRAFTVSINADGRSREIGFRKGTVKDALKSARIKLKADDEVMPALGEKIKSGDVINVNRVSYRTTKKKETIRYKTVKKRTTTLYRGYSKVTKEGENGEQIVTYKEKLVNGKVQSAKALDKQVTKQPVNCEKLIGSKVKVLSKHTPISQIALPSRYTLDKDGIPTGIKSTINGTAKAYTCNFSSYRGSGRTASGAKAKCGYIAVNPSQIPYGTEMYIVSSNGKYIYGYCIAADTGGFAQTKSATCDLYMDTFSECCQWGSKNVDIYILNWGNGRI